MQSVYFLVKNRIPHTTISLDLIEFLVANGDTLLEKHLRENPANAQYTSKFSTVSMIETIDTWVERKLLESLKVSPFFSILADECQDLSAQEELFLLPLDSQSPHTYKRRISTVETPLPFLAHRQLKSPRKQNQKTPTGHRL